MKLWEDEATLHAVDVIDEVIGEMAHNLGDEWLDTCHPDREYAKEVDKRIGDLISYMRKKLE